MKDEGGRTRWVGGIAGGATLAAMIFSASPAGAAVTIGETFAPTIGCGGTSTTVINSQSAAAPAAQYASPSAGVITSWSYRGGAGVAPFIRLTIVRPAGGANFTTVGRSGVELPVAGALSTYATRIPVLAGDILGYFYTATHQCAGVSAGYAIAFLNTPETTVGATNTWGPPLANTRLPISAQLEPDADNDGFGDETQDLCPTQADTVKACRDITPPETTITKKPRKKDKKKKPKFEFNSSEVAPTFRCSLNGSKFEPCTAPHSVKAKKGLNTFTVFAVDTAGNIDESPTTYSWTYKKSKKK